MAVPKKKTSKSRTHSRRAFWERKIVKFISLALSLGKSVKSNSKFVFN